MDPKSINIKDFSYELPESRIAKFPLEERDASKLLYYNGGKIDAHSFRALPELLPEGALLVFNNTKVIHARLHFTLPNDKRLEILCLEPLAPAEYQQNFSSAQKVRWKCLVGGNRKWKKERERYPIKRKLKRRKDRGTINKKKWSNVVH